MNDKIKIAMQHFHKRKNRPKNFPLIHKNFDGANNPYVWCKIVDFYDDKVVIQFYSGTEMDFDLNKFIENYKNWESEGFPSIPYHDDI